MEDTQLKFVDPENYNGSFEEKVSFKDIALSQFRRICTFASREFRGGYWSVKSVASSKGGLENRDVYNPDTREEYSNAVDCLADILSPHFDEIIIEHEEEHEQKIREIQKEIFNEAKDYIDESKINTFKDKKVLLKRKLFRELSKFLYRIKYLQSKQYDDEDD